MYVFWLVCLSGSGHSVRGKLCSCPKKCVYDLLLRACRALVRCVRFATSMITLSGGLDFVASRDLGPGLLASPILYVVWCDLRSLCAPHLLRTDARISRTAIHWLTCLPFLLQSVWTGLLGLWLVCGRGEVVVVSLVCVKVCWVVISGWLSHSLSRLAIVLVVVLGRLVGLVRVLPVLCDHLRRLAIRPARMWGHWRSNLDFRISDVLCTSSELHAVHRLLPLVAVLLVMQL